MNQYVFILAGGSGKRLWPLGRQKLPKQFIPFQDEKTLLDLTIERMSLMVPPERIWILTVAEYQDMMKTYAHQVGRIIAEPKARNTGPAIFYALQQLHLIDSQASIIVTPSDHAINDNATLIHAIKDAQGYAQHNNTIVLCGIRPTYPATGYGYIERTIRDSIAPVIKFHEKPTQDSAQHYIGSDSFLWNTGIFCATVKALLHEYILHTSASYEYLATESIDYMIFEKSGNLQVIEAQCDWSDVGTLDLFVAAKKGNNQDVVTLNAHNIVVHGTKKLVVVMDVDDISVIETTDVLLITRRSETEKIKNVVEYLKDNGYEEFI